MKKLQRANAFLQDHEELLDEPGPPTEVAEALDVSKIKSRYASLPASLKVPATVGHVALFAEVIIEEIERLRVATENLGKTVSALKVARLASRKE